MRQEPGLREDAKNLSLITGSALVAVALTIGLVAGRTRAAPQPERIARTVEPVVVDVEPALAPLPPTGAQRLYGTVITVDGSRLTGYIRWDRNEGSTFDVLDATKPGPRGGSSISGIRFGHVAAIDVTGHRSARFTLRSGAQVDLGSDASDLGTGLRSLLVDRGDGRVAELGWGDLARVELAEPGDAPPSENRLYGTLTTRTGARFAGYVAWDVDEIYSTDVLDGDRDGERVRVPFGDVSTIERHGSWGARVTLRSGASMILEGTNDVDASIRNITVSDPALGQVLLHWDEFDMVEFHGPPEGASASFDGGSPLRGSVVTRTGESYEGEIVWDDDERFSWEMLNGEAEGIEFSIEFGNVERIARTPSGSVVTLRDGRTFELSRGNDVDRGNRGIRIRTDGREFEVDWDDFAEVRFDG